MKRIVLLQFLMVSMLVVACKKEKAEKLDNEKAILVGEWEWNLTYRGESARSGFMGIDTLTTLNYPYSYKLRFIEDGIVYFYVNGELKSEEMIRHIASSGANVKDVYMPNMVKRNMKNAFLFDLQIPTDSKKEGATAIFRIIVNQDSIHTSNYFPNSHIECVTNRKVNMHYNSFFKRI